ncbi:hypothetical protein [Methylobacterium pseudosasicola]|uniref:Uncharacterized protein n=1 Tax=Methylobacterium pseudosasicola TaxID=582667 RepID=A0A1I4MPC5_9HYPH|nr:hypothetical protein [Methylobacterium pseudosasicola]SFM04923.1 hypothetical protein SAMN05192568_1017105 [Methylobacterium pseudosasicola]
MFETCDTQLWDGVIANVYDIEGFDLDVPGLDLDADDKIEERRDRALTFVRRLSRAQMEHLGLLTGDAKRDEARAGILAAGVIAHQEGRRVSVSFRSNHYSGRARYAGSAYTYRIVPDLVEELAEAGWIELDKAPVGRNKAKGRQSTYTVTERTLAALGDNPVFELHLNDPIRMRGADKRLVPYEDTDFTRERRDQLIRVNKMLASIDIGTRNPDIVRLPDHRWRLPGLCSDGRGGFRPRHVRSDARAVHVVHNNEDWDQNGRMTGLFIQQLPKAERELITIAGEPVVLLDYACSHLVLAYARVGLKLEGDAYAIPGWEGERKFVKRATVTAINCAKKTRRKGRQQAVNAIAHDLAVRDAKAGAVGVEKAMEQKAGEIRPSKAHRQKAHAVLKAIEKRHASIRESFYSGIGLRFMRTEADVMLAVMLAAIDKGIPLLPVYDEFVVRVSDAEEVYKLMVAHWRAEVGFEPMIDRPSPVAQIQETAALSQNGNTPVYSYVGSCLHSMLPASPSSAVPLAPRSPGLAPPIFTPGIL